MELLFVIIGSFIVCATVMTIVGITLHDVRLVRSDARYGLGNRRRYKRPLVSIVVDDDVAPETIKSIRRSDYRKKEIVFVGEQPHGDLVLYLPYRDTVGRTAISQAVRAFIADPHLNSAELIPLFRTPTTLRQFFRLYRNMALAPFTSVKIAFRIPTRGSRWPLLMRRGASHNALYCHSYGLVCWLLSLANAVVLVYVFFVATWLSQPLFLMVYPGLFGIWMGVSFWHYEDFSPRQKITYILLLPATLGFFAVLALRAPLRPAIRFVSHVTAALSWRSSRRHLA